MPRITCLQCGETEHKEYNQKFCGRSCATTYNNKRRRHTSETKNKIRDSLLKEREPIQCKGCSKEFVPDKYYRKYCSNECSISGRGRRKRNQISRRTVSKIMRRAFLNWKCPFCNWNNTWDIHHIIPRKFGGTDDLNNLVMLCPNHHSLADLGQMDNEKMVEYAIGKFYSVRELLDLHYFGKKKTFDINWART